MKKITNLSSISGGQFDEMYVDTTDVMFDDTFGIVIPDTIEEEIETGEFMTIEVVSEMDTFEITSITTV